MGCLLPFTDAQKEFLDRLLDGGEVIPSLLTGGTHLAERIHSHPLLQWKVQNVRQHRSFP